MHLSLELSFLPRSSPGWRRCGRRVPRPGGGRSCWAWPPCQQNPQNPQQLPQPWPGCLCKTCFSDGRMWHKPPQSSFAKATQGCRGLRARPQLTEPVPVARLGDRLGGEDPLGAGGGDWFLGDPPGGACPAAWAPSSEGPASWLLPLPARLPNSQLHAASKASIEGLKLHGSGCRSAGEVPRL